MLFLLPNFNLIRDCLGFVLFNAVCLRLFTEKHHCHGNGQQIHFVSGTGSRHATRRRVSLMCQRRRKGIRNRRIVKGLRTN